MGVPWSAELEPSDRTMRLLVLLTALALLFNSAAGNCSKALDCAIKRRESCTPGLNGCGSCLPEFIEDERGNCVQKHSVQQGKHHGAPDIDGDIDYIASILAKKVDSSHTLHLDAVDDSMQTIKLEDESKAVRADIPSNRVKSILTTHTPQKKPEVSAVKNDPKKAPVPVADAILLTLIITCTVAGISGLIIAGIYWYRLQKEAKLTQKVDYVSYGKAGPTAQTEKSLNGDNKLAQCAQMYHYQHQKQQMLSMEKNKDESKVADSATESEGENEDGDFTVYECPGLAPTGEMEVKNPLFDDSSLHHPPTSS